MGNGDMAVTFVGYPMPCLLGSGRCHNPTRHAWSVLVCARTLLVPLSGRSDPTREAGSPRAPASPFWASRFALNGSPIYKQAVAVGLVCGMPSVAPTGIRRNCQRRGQWTPPRWARHVESPESCGTSAWALIGIVALVTGVRYLLHG